MFILNTGTKDQLGRITQGIFAIADAHRYCTKNEKEDSVGKATD